MTSSVIVPRGYMGRPGMIPWKVLTDGVRLVVNMFIPRNVSVNIMLMPLPPSMKTRLIAKQPI